MKYTHDNGQLRLSTTGEYLHQPNVKYGESYKKIGMRGFLTIIIVWVFFLECISCQNTSPYNAIIQGDVDEPEDFFSNIDFYKENMTHGDFNLLIDSLIVNNKDLQSLNLMIFYLRERGMCDKILLVEECCRYFRSLPPNYEWKVEIRQGYFRRYNTKDLHSVASPYNALNNFKKICY